MDKNAAIDLDAVIEQADSGGAVVEDLETPAKKRRRRRRARPRAKTFSRREVIKQANAARMLVRSTISDDEIYERPRTRGECQGTARPCPWVSCKHHLYLDITDAGSLKINFPDLEPWELKDSCALDVAERGAITLEEIGTVTNLTRERVRQIEVRGLLTLKRRSPHPDGNDGK